MKKLLIACITLFTIISMAQAQVPSYVPTIGLVSWYPFNGNANDASGNGKNGTIYGGVTLTTDRFNNPNNSYNFNGTTGAILADTFYVSNNFTASFWYLASSSINLSASNNQNSGSTILCKGASISPCNYADFAFGFKNGYYGTGEQNCTSNSWLETELGWGCNYTYVSNCNSNISLQYNWTNLTIVLSSGYLKRYSNGVLIDSITYTAHSGLLANSGYPLSIGGRYVANTSQGTFGFWMGKIDDIGIWNRALDSNEVKGLFLSQNCKIQVTQSGDNTSLVGSTAKLTVSSPDYNPKYQWQTNIGSGYIDLSNAGQYSGVNDSVLLVKYLTKADNNSKFRCHITTDSCTGYSTPATLFVNCVVTQQPRDTVVLVGDKAVFSVYSVDQNAQYQWQIKNGASFIDLTSAGQYKGTNNDTLEINNVSLNNNSTFRCKVASA